MTGRVLIKKKVKIGSAWQLLTVVEEKGKIRWDYVMASGVPERHTEGTYYIEWWEGSTRRRESINADTHTDVLTAARKKYIELQAIREGVIKEQQIVAGGGQRTEVKAAVQDYKDLVKNRVRPDGTGYNTWRKYRMVMDLFSSTCRKRYIDQLEASDARNFLQACYGQGNGERTARHKLVIVAQFLKKLGVKDFVDKDDWPKYTAKRREIYEEDDLKAFFAHCTARQRMIFRFFLHTGFRDREVIHATWSDLNFRTHVAAVTAKPHWKFRPKNHEERQVPVRASFMAELQAFKPKDAQPGHPIFGTPLHTPDLHLLQMCKTIAYKAGLNCVHCRTEWTRKDGSKKINRCSNGPYCTKWFLHKFRHTYATRLLQQGVADVRTLQDWLGHKDLATTMIYLKSIPNKDAQDRLASFSVGGD